MTQTQTQKIARLESLLARIRTRSAQPRPSAERAIAAPVDVEISAMADAVTVIVNPPVVPAAAAPPPVLAAPPAPAPPVLAAPPPVGALSPSLATPAVSFPAAMHPGVVTAVMPAMQPPEALAPTELDELEEIDELTIPPPRVEPAAAGPRAALPTETDVVLEVEVLPDLVGDMVIGVAAEEVIVAESLGSRERLVAAEPVLGVMGDVASPESADESPPEVLASVEEVDEPPASSRRPVVPQPEERLADMAFGAEEPSPPRHTPPPESGRLPAAPAMEFDADVTGVREATPIAPRIHELVPQPVRADLAAHDSVADFVGEAQRFAPQTFAALLDASLAL